MGVRALSGRGGLRHSYLPQFQTYREIKLWTILLRYPTSPD